jgi:two-component system sensor histidine kinase BaeS
MPFTFPAWLARWRRPGLTLQLFLAVLATAALVTVLLGVATQWSFHRGFIGYLSEQAVTRMEAALPRLQAAYAAHRSWDFVRGRPDVWFGLVGVERTLPPRPDMPQQERDMVASDMLGAGRRMALLDAQRQHVIGFPFTLADSVQREVVVDGETVGWLTIAPIYGLTDAAALRFLDAQLQASLLVGTLALGLAALIAWWAARRLLAPVREVAAATHQVAAGAYDTRVSLGRDDEVGQLARDFNCLAQQLQRNEQLRRTFMAEVSHELRTPLAVLKGELEAIEDGVRQPSRDNLAALQAEVAALTQLVDDLHELALADVGALSYHFAAIDLRDVVEPELQLLRHVAEGRSLRVSADMPTTPLRIQGDAGRLRQLLRNTLSNALRYTDAGGEVQLRLASEGDQVAIDVMDSPPGVPDALLPRLFDRFFRVEASRNRATGGSGLGLAICRSIAEAHGGTIEARHAPIGGLWVRIRLPAAPALST